jgi:hypothetical protein
MKSVKKYGIYLFYPPGVKLAQEGLGRHLLEFLKATQNRKDIEFAIACPSWMRTTLQDLLESDGLKIDDFQILAPIKKPILLQLHSYFLERKNKKTTKNRFLNIKAVIKNYFQQQMETYKSKIAGIDSYIYFIFFGSVILYTYFFGI